MLKRTREIVKRMDASEMVPIVRMTVDRAVCCPSGPRSMSILCISLEVDCAFTTPVQ